MGWPNCSRVLAYSTASSKDCTAAPMPSSTNAVARRSLVAATAAAVSPVRTAPVTPVNVTVANLRDPSTVGMATISIPGVAVLTAMHAVFGDDEEEIGGCRVEDGRTRAVEYAVVGGDP